MGREREHGRDKFLFVCTSSSGPIDRLTHISSVRVWCYPSQPPSSPSSSSSSLPPPWVSHFLYDLFPCYLLCFLTIANEGSYYSASSSSPPDCRDSDEQAIRDTRTEMKGRRRRGRELVALPWRPAMGTRGGEEEEARDKCPARCCRQIIDAQEPRQETLTTIRYKQWTPRK